MGHLSGPELQAPGGRRFAADDMIVALAPAADPTVLTSQWSCSRQVMFSRSAPYTRSDSGYRCDARMTELRSIADL